MYRRYHQFRTSSSRNLLIADSQVRNLIFPNFNILSLPGARIGSVIDFLPEKGKYDLIVLFIGGNDAYERNVPSSVSEQDIANEISKLADELSLRAPKIFILGIPHRGEYRKRASDVNGFLRTKKGNWKYRGLCDKIYCIYHLKEDEVHLNKEGLRGIQSILKNKILYTKYSDSCNREGHLATFECRFRNCNCTY